MKYESSLLSSISLLGGDGVGHGDDQTKRWTVAAVFDKRQQFWSLTHHHWHTCCRRERERERERESLGIQVTRLTLVDDVGHSLSSQSIIQWNQNTRIVITRLFSHHPLRQRGEVHNRTKEEQRYTQLTSGELRAYIPTNESCPVSMPSCTSPAPNWVAASSTWWSRIVSESLSVCLER